MIPTLIARIDDLVQFDQKKKQVLWADGAPDRWMGTYEKLKVGDGAIFLTTRNSALIGKVSKIVKDKRVQCDHIEELQLKTGELLQLHDAHPELITRVKGHFDPFLHPKKLSLEKLKVEVKSRNFVSNYVFASKDDYLKRSAQLKENDRVLIMQAGRFDTVFLHSSVGLRAAGFNDQLSVTGKSLDEVSSAHKEGKGSDTGNNVRLVTKISKQLNSDGFFKFDSFSAYHNALFNKRVFGKTDPTALASGHTVFGLGAGKGKALNGVNDGCALNQILYGPPGTGKTYSTIERALAILGEPTEDVPREDLKRKFEQYTAAGQIVFCTFHQSLGYEDFVEGIKPIVPEKDGDPVTYRVEHGIFRRLCLEASFAVAASSQRVQNDEMKRFASAYDNIVDDVEQALAKSVPLTLAMKSGGKLLVDSLSTNDNLLVKHAISSEPHTVSRDRLMKLWMQIPDLDSVTNVRLTFDPIIGGCNTSAYWAVLNHLRKEPPVSAVSPDREYSWDEKQQIVQSLTHQDYKDSDAKRYVLIIDEINRGNVSQIFGELITLLEDDKRLGCSESLTVVLPYSKTTFAVPPNLYVVGTMNTADRSVEALDTALRRRFVFEEKAPEPRQLKALAPICGVSLDALLTVINDRLEMLLGRDHLIGHSYFLTVDSPDALKHVMCRKIVPLLREYFYGDYGKIGLVLGNGFVRIKNNSTKKSAVFANFDYETDEIGEGSIYEIVADEELKIETAIALMGVPGASAG